MYSQWNNKLETIGMEKKELQMEMEMEMEINKSDQFILPNSPKR